MAYRNNESGEYTPAAASNLNNITSVSYTGHGHRYIRMGNTVMVTGAATVVFPTSAVGSSFEIPLPVASTLNIGGEDIAGVANASFNGFVGASNNKALIQFGADVVLSGTYTVKWSFMYNIK